MAYADYDYYVNDYMGTYIDADSFNALIGPACAWLDRICGSVLCREAECVKLASCAVCDVLAEFDGRAYIKSESSDGYSADYCIDENTQSKRIYAAAKVYLDDELLYRGII